jgi:acyl-CoA reductase-like NAD-dependent aldehyde dehydrogenase
LSGVGRTFLNRYGGGRAAPADSADGPSLLVRPCPLHKIARNTGKGAQRTFNAFADLADSFPFEEPAKPSVGQFGLIVREPVGVVGAIIPWNAPMGLISNKVAPALLAGCTVILKNSAEAPGEGYLIAEAAEAVGLLVASRQRDRVEGYIAKGIADWARLATGGGRPKDLERGWFVEPTVFGNVDNRSVIAQEEIFGPVLSVVPAEDEQDAIRVANDTIYGLNASVFTNDVNRAREVAGQLRSGTVGHNAFRTDFGIAFGGFKQSGIGREGGTEGLLPFLETKTVILEGRPAGYDS